jgi:putative Mg2+ transporter-C (MgtC) family protein
MPSLDVLLFRFLLVIIVGGLIGAEREYRSKSAGFRTMILICLGSFLFTSFSIYIGGDTSDRIASNIVTGIGFLGAGVIFKSDNQVKGLTTAATIWATAALGMGIADGEYIIVTIGTVIVLASLFLFTRLEEWLDRISHTKNYKIVSIYKSESPYYYEAILKEYKLKYRLTKQIKNGEIITGSWIAYGLEKNHIAFIERILNDGSVKEFEF